MTVLDTFSGKKKRIEPPISAATSVPDHRLLHPEAQKAAAIYSDALQEVDRLREELKKCRADSNEEIRQLRSDLEVERRHLQELQHMLDGERRQKEHYSRYAVAVRTHLEHVASAAIRANDVAMEMASDPASSKVDNKALEKVEEAALEVAMSSNGGNSGTVKDEPHSFASTGDK